MGSRSSARTTPTPTSPSRITGVGTWVERSASSARPTTIVNCGAAAQLTIVVGLAELADRSTHVPTPVILEGDVGVGVVRALEREPIGRPPLPPVVVQLEAIVEEARLTVKESRPGAP